MAGDVLSIVRKCQDCIWFLQTHFRHQELLKLFLTARWVKFVAMDLLGPLKRTARGSNLILAMTDRLTEMKGCVWSQTTTSSTAADSFFEYWIYAYGAQLYVLTNNRRQFVAQFSDFLCRIPGSRYYLTAAYHPQIYGETKRLSKTIVPPPWTFVAEHQTSWDQYLQALAYSCSMRARGTMETKKCELVLAEHLPSTTKLGTSDRPGMPASDEGLTPVQYKRTVLRQLAYAMRMDRNKRVAAKKSCKKHFNETIRFWLEVQLGDEVYINRPSRRMKRGESKTADTHGV